MKNEEKKLTSDNGSAVDSGDKRGKRLDRKKLIYLFSTIGFSAFFCAFYYCSMELSSKSLDYYYFFPIVMFGYMAALTVLVLVYIIYNRGFSRKGVTADMLPDEWSEERKTEFIRSGEKRLERSKWILVFIISLLFTFIVEAIILFAVPFIKGLFT
jgi:hypothetical protein